MIAVTVICDNPEHGAVVAAALEADRDLAIVGRSSDVAAAAAGLAAQAPDVIVLLQTRRELAPRLAVQRAAVDVGAAVIVLTEAPADAAQRMDLRARVRAAPAGRDRRSSDAAPRPLRSAAPRQTRLIAIGSSTGGVEALVQLLARFPANTPPTVIVQHMPQNFTTSFAARLDGLCAARVEEAWDGAPLEPGRIYLAPGGPAHLEVQWSPARAVRLIEADPVNRHRPSVDVCFHSIVRAQAPGVVGVLLTGMGRDGAEGLLAIRRMGGRTIAQNRETSTVYGMPRAALEIGAVDAGTPLNQIAEAIFTGERQVKEAI